MFLNFLKKFFLLFLVLASLALTHCGEGTETGNPTLPTSGDTGTDSEECDPETDEDCETECDPEIDENCE